MLCRIMEDFDVCLYEPHSACWMNMHDGSHGIRRLGRLVNFSRVGMIVSIAPATAGKLFCTLVSGWVRDTGAPW